MARRRGNGISLVRKFSRKAAMDPRRESRTFVLSQGERRPAGEGSGTDSRADGPASPGDRRDHGLGRQRLVEVRLRGPKRQLGARGVFRPTGAWTPAQARAAPSQICGGSRRVRGRPSKSTAHRSLFTRRTDVREDVRGRDRYGERAPREVGETVHSLGPSGRASERSRPGARPLTDERAGVLPAVSDLDVFLSPGKFLELLLANGRSAEALIEAAADLLFAQDPDKQGAQATRCERASAFTNERASVALALGGRKHVDRVDLARVLRVARPLGPGEGVADNVGAVLRDEDQLGGPSHAETLAAALDVRLELVDETVGEKTAVRRAPGLDADALDRCSVVGRRTPDAHFRGARRTSRRSGERARRDASACRRA